MSIAQAPADEVTLDPSLTEALRHSPLTLRQELSLRALAHARTNNHLHHVTDAGIPSILFGMDELGRHGNFHPAAYNAILANLAWSRRLTKVHTASRRNRPRADWHWRELDCANSSDALLMNIFCYPDVLSSPHLRRLLGLDDTAHPVFGFKPRAPLGNGKFDATEVDLHLGDLMIEAKLTESDFQTCAPRLIERYRDLEQAFELSDLPLSNGKHTGYQLIRGVLAAHATGNRFCVLCDHRRPDLLEGWYTILRAVRRAELRSRLAILTWQEVAATLPSALQDFLCQKYGIQSRRHAS